MLIDPLPEIRAVVAADAKVYTDEFGVQWNTGKAFDVEMVNHAECYVRNQVHTNGLENFWSLLKRGIGGTYISVEPFHLFRYVDERAFRFNTRKHADGEGITMVSGSTWPSVRLLASGLLGPKSPARTAKNRKPLPSGRLLRGPKRKA